jgi:uncharacterized protein
MTTEQWESLCDGCGRCCLVKVWHDQTVKSSRVGCRLLDLNTGCCGDYENRKQKVSTCVKVTPNNLDTPGLLPRTCAYKLVQAGQLLYPWHHLISGSKQTVIDAGISVVGYASINETGLSMHKYNIYLLDALDQEPD